ncbi:phosphomevalonate kinase [Verruconis gallopava]|uniref:Phosphomevalonate kinase n=1 Tax=Verruconis gallopava TaxID=253628 RepID=A0A0D2AK95_9PEZI|nr:phosphomevalonate kinase [Verruconis gallopava]KIW06980.1 phosphomevalonate kinase [Verruconis gallopava]
MMTSFSASASAPGKVFLAGGYLVLDREYTALVFGLDARIHAHIEPLKTTSGVHLEEIVVRSPQFREAHWEYGYRATEEAGGVKVTQLRVSAQDKIKKNPFIETTLSYVLTYIASVTSPNIPPSIITILADDSYYTTSNPSGSSSTGSSKTFSDFGVKLSDAHKTGLGSSAALVTSLTAALLLHYLPKGSFSLDNEASKKRLHNLAQTAHCAAQGKVGSGFDIATAVYGSCLYRRFSPSLLDGLGNPASAGFSARLKALVEESGPDSTWDVEVFKQKVKIPKGLRLVMCDVDCGSETPGMVKQVLAWRAREHDEADMLWGALQTRNEALAAELTRIAATGGQGADYAPLKSIIAEIRNYIREMSRLSGVPIEPPPQTKLIDACSQVEGVIGGVVPGAGGYDAIALLIEDKEDVLRRLDAMLETWQVEVYAEPGSGPSIGKVTRLPVREEMDGIRVEDASKYGKWIQ